VILPVICNACLSKRLFYLGKHLLFFNWDEV
jgi:hypothetical protein